ncbi:uncharacterized protein [Drosophila pseudoobscura]|uniref:Uncharacterized protein n=1 Tax=Drosophila pseudoobscura pseudoobscura TaxID=46245 RepID=A0A6I8V4C5_DROPS|nr:uncharacterized protein LOC6898573 [Drosophila pseudoobscura]
MSGKLLSGLLNGVLCGIGGYGCCKLDPFVQPVGYMSCVMAYTHGTLGLIVSLRKAAKGANPQLCVTRNLMEVGHMTLINTQFYHSTMGSGRALVFGLSMGLLGVLSIQMPKVILWRPAIGFCNVLCLLCSPHYASSWGTHLMIALLYAAGSDGVYYLKGLDRLSYAERLYEVCNIGITHLAIKAFMENM